jgi:hypothetical protein
MGNFSVSAPFTPARGTGSAAARGAGTTAGTPPVDILGVARTVPYSDGAYGYRQ